MMLADHRLKKVQGKKKRDADAAEAKRRADLAAQVETDTADPTPPPADAAAEDDSTAVDLLSSKDNDVIF
jgi:V-type H+-transporting ATPase subunit D